jgi:hypothetical protein
MNQTEARVEAKRLLAKKGMTAEDVVASLIQTVAEANENLDAMSEVANHAPEIADKEKQLVLKQACSSGAHPLYLAFQYCKIPNEISATVQHPDGMYQLTFRKLLGVVE